jgi:hypothetical protein
LIKKVGSLEELVDTAGKRHEATVSKINIEKDKEKLDCDRKVEELKREMQRVLAESQVLNQQLATEKQVSLDFRQKHAQETEKVKSAVE